SCIDSREDFRTGCYNSRRFTHPLRGQRESVERCGPVRHARHRWWSRRGCLTGQRRIPEHLSGEKLSMHTAVMVLFVLNAVTLVGIVLIQHGKGADAGAAFGSGASATVFGSRGSSSFLSRFTAVLATTFFTLAIVLAYMGQSQE